MRTFIEKAGKTIKCACAAAAVMLCVLFLDQTAIVSQAADIKLNSNAKVRSEASTDSAVVTNVSSGATLSSLGEVTGADGYTWYQISVNGATGYIRSDLADKVSGDMTQAEVERENSYTETSATVSESSVSAGTISVDSANVRKGPSSSDAPVTNVKSGTEVAVTGEAIGADGNTWYQISVNGKTGFVRSDLITPTASEETDTEDAEQPEEEAAEEPEEAEQPEDSGTTEISNVISSRILPGDVDLEDMTIDESLLEEWESGNYYVLYTKDADGKDGWYLYSLSDNQFERIKSLHDDGEDTKDGGLLSGDNKLIVLIAAALFIVLVIACIILALKLHEYRSYYEDDEDEDDEDDDEDDEDEDDEDDEDERPVRKKSRWSPKNFLSRRDEDDDEDDEDDEDEEDEEDEEDDEDEDDEEDEEYLDDDDFEFEFLNMDGKDKFR